jgi:hypothetical protein
VGSVSHKTILIAFGLIAITLLAVMGLFLFRPALALDNASSSPQGSDNNSTNSVSATSSDSQLTDTTLSTINASAPSAVATSTNEATSSSAATVAPATTSAVLKEVHIIGTKYIDYFTDGTIVTSSPGDPQIDAHLSEPNAATPTHEGLTWAHTTGQNLYDTPSGDLEVGDYAIEANGERLENDPPFVSSTTTPAQEAQTSTSTDAGSDAGAATAQSDASTSASDASQSAVSTSSPSGN